MSNSTTGPGTIPPPLPAFDNTLGAVVLGGLFTMALWGITCLQTYDFYMEKSRDKKPFKLLIFALWIMDTIDAAMICHTVYFYSVSNYVNPRVIAGPTWSFWVHAGVTILANSIIRGLFTVRIYRMSQFNMAATLWIMATSLACLIAGYIAISKGSHLSTFAELDEILAAIYVTFISGAVSDISVAIILCILLHKSKTKFSKTNSLIKVLRLYTINTSFIVAIDDLVILITKCVTPNNLVFMAFYFCLGKLYLNAYLATLNARQKLRNKSNKPTTVHLSDMGFGTSISTGSDSDGLPIHSAMNPNFVEISVETVVDNKH